MKITKLKDDHGYYAYKNDKLYQGKTRMEVILAYLIDLITRRK